ncbi:MAG: Gfo/Idh/MocA family oxidoreductase, partial [Bacteroidetes bacterium]|nr:Gfo/Idh/MocA family oxidoreductase [Bacteroidota bacterium]
IKLSVIGCGKWGINHVRTAFSLIGNNLITVCDTDKDAGVKVKDISQEINFQTDINAIVEDKSINAVIIATPAETHFEIAKLCLEHGKHVLVEKPITLFSSEAESLLSLAEKKKLVLMVGHVLLYHPAVLKMKDMIDGDYIGKVQYIYSNRLNLGTIRKEESILWSFAPHDVSVIQFLLDNRKPVTVLAEGATFLQKNIEDTTLTYIKYPDNVHAHIYVSWLHPFKEQRLVVIGDKGMIVFEDSLKTEKLKYYKKGFSIVDGELEKFDSDYEVVRYENLQPLEQEQKHFYECIIKGGKPRTDGLHAKEVLEILEKAQSKMNK